MTDRQRFARVFSLCGFWLFAVMLAPGMCHEDMKGGFDAVGDGPIPENADDFGFTGENVTVLSHLPMSELGGVKPVSDRANFGKANGSDLWGWTDPETNREYALFGRSDTLAFVDVTNPNDPAYLGLLPTHSLNRIYRDVKTFGNYAYIVADVAEHGMQVFDLTRLRGVTEAPADFWIPDAHFDGFGGAHNIVINPESGFAMVVGSDTYRGGMYFVDIQDPLHPKPLGGVQSLGYTHDAQAITYRGPDEDYSGREIVLAYTVDSLSIVDASDPGEPVIVSRTGYEHHRYAHQGWVTEDHKYALMNDELDELQLEQLPRTHIWNIEDLDSPEYLGFYEASVRYTDHNLYIEGDYVYQANYLGGLRILDISNIENGKLTEVAWLDTQPQIDSPYFSGLWSVYPYFESGSLIMSDMVKGLIVARMNSSEISIVGDFNEDRIRDAADLDLLWAAASEASGDLRFDVDNDGVVAGLDQLAWVRDVFESSAGDANLDGTFNTTDLILVFQNAEYEDGVPNNSTWADGDWNGDGEFGTGDLVIAFQDGAYRADVAIVPESNGILLIVIAVVHVALRRQKYVM